MHYRKTIIALILLLAAFTAGCGASQEKQWREKAEEHLAALQKKVGDADQLTLSKDKPAAEDKSTYAIFSAASKIYGSSFSVYVTRDGSSGEDDYYRLYLKEEAEKRVNALVAETLGADAPKFQVSILSGAGTAGLSLHKISSLDEFLEKTESSLLVSAKLVSDGKITLTEEQADKLLLAFQEEGLFCRLYPYPSSAVSFEILKDEFWKTTQTGADKGAYVQRDKYEPSK